jgi:hypothetical protein
LACHLQIDVDLDPDSVYNFYTDADPDPTFQFDANPDPQHCFNLEIINSWKRLTKAKKGLQKRKKL